MTNIAQFHSYVEAKNPIDAESRKVVPKGGQGAEGRC
jgi:hypothetical protein